MRRLDKKITDEKIIEEILLKSDICRLGLIDNGSAYIVPVNYAYKDGVIYIHSAKEGKKISILQSNNQVAFEIEYNHQIMESEKACGWTTKYRSVMGKGTVAIAQNVEEKTEALDLIMRKYEATIELNYDRRVLERVCILQLQIESIEGKQSGEW